MLVFAGLVVAGVTLYFMTPEERRRLLDRSAALARSVFCLSWSAARQCRLGRDDPFYAALRERAPLPVITWLFAASMVVVFALMIAADGALADPATLVSWGANFAPRTTGGERWRVFTSMFLHDGVLRLAINLVTLLQLGLIAERVAGPFTFGIIFLAAGAFGSTMDVSTSPMKVSLGPASAIFGVYGLLFATGLRSALRRADVRIPLRVLRPLAPVAGIFLLSCLFTGESATGAKAGLCTGLIAGLALTRRVADRQGRLKRLAALGGATAAIVVSCAMALRAVTDVRPEIAAVVASEARAATAYETAVEQFRKGRITTGELARTIETTIIPDVQRGHHRISNLNHVAPPDAPLVADTLEYLRLRQTSWRLKVEALRKGNMRLLREADQAERASLQTLQRVKPAVAR